MRPPESSLKNGGIVDVKFCSTDQLNHDEFHWIISKSTTGPEKEGTSCLPLI